jgi:hypothetical protein
MVSSLLLGLFGAIIIEGISIQGFTEDENNTHSMSA